MPPVTADLNRTPSARQGFRGLTALEMLFVCAIAALLLTLTVPSFHEMALNARRTEHVNGLLHGLHAARIAAISRAEAVVLCRSLDSKQCAPGAATWHEGWIMFVNLDRDSPPRVDPEEEVLLVQKSVAGLKILANRAAVTYWPVSMAGTTVSFVFCDERGASAARTVIVSQTGRPRISDRNPSGGLLSCV